MMLVKLLTMDIWIILANVAAIVIVFLILVFLWLDKKRFHIERQFRAVQPLFDHWMDSAAAVPGCEEYVIVYHRTRNVTEKYRAIGAVSNQAWGYETAAMKATAGELEVFLGVYNSLAEEYNRRLNSRFTGRIARLLGFQKLPDLKLETEHVQN